MRVTAAREAVAAAGLRLDVLRAAPSSRRRPEIACSRLLSLTATSAPRGLDQRVLGDDLARARHEQEQYIELPRAKRNRLVLDGEGAGILRSS